MLRKQRRWSASRLPRSTAKLICVLFSHMQISGFLTSRLILHSRICCYGARYTHEGWVYLFLRYFQIAVPLKFLDSSDTHMTPSLFYTMGCAGVGGRHTHEGWVYLLIRYFWTEPHCKLSEALLTLYDFYIIGCAGVGGRHTHEGWVYLFHRCCWAWLICLYFLH